MKRALWILAAILGIITLVCLGLSSVFMIAPQTMTWEPIPDPFPDSISEARAQGALSIVLIIGLPCAILMVAKIISGKNK